MNDLEQTSPKTVAKWLANLFERDWKPLLKTYSFIFHVLAVILTIVEIILPYMMFIEPIFGPTAYGVLMFVLNILGAIGRLMKQNSIP